MSVQWFSVLRADQVQEGSYQVVFVNFISILVGKNQGTYFALENICSHDGNELEGGELQGEEVICPRHGAGFCIKTGDVTRPPACEGIRRFPLRVEHGEIQIAI